MNKLLAQTDLFPAGGFKGLGPGPLADPGTNAPTLFASVLSTAIGIITVVAVIWFIFLFITGAIAIMNAGGDKQALEAARKKITTGILGLVIVIISIFVFDLVGYLLGFDQGGFLNIQKMINDAQIK